MMLTWKRIILCLVLAERLLIQLYYCIIVSVSEKNERESR